MVTTLTDLQTHVVVFGECLAQGEGQDDQHQVDDAHHYDADDQFTLSNQPLGEDLVAALEFNINILINKELKSTTPSTYLLVETVAIAGISGTVLIARHQLGHVLEDAAGLRNGAVALSVHPRRRGLKVAVVGDAAASKVAHQLVPHQRCGIHILAQGVAGDGRLQEGLALSPNSVLVEGSQSAGRNLGNQEENQKGSILKMGDLKKFLMTILR